MPASRLVSCNLVPVHGSIFTPPQVLVSYLEIYNEVGYDLLDPAREVAQLEDMPQARAWSGPLCLLGEAAGLVEGDLV